ncbi:unnamed protein product [Diamesa serratosioi]
MKTVLCLVLSALIACSVAFPQERTTESPVIFIDFNYSGKPGESKSLRSLDQYQDGQNSARSDLKTDSYGNPVTQHYDDLDNLNGNSGKNKFVIPGYASGILGSHETTNGAGAIPDGQRKYDDDRITFVDSYQNTYKNTQNSLFTPSTGLATPPFGSQPGIENNSPVDIPKPNIDAAETPVTPIDDPLNGPLNPPQQTPSPGLVGPVGFGPGVGNNDSPVIIPKPNIGIQETPITENDGPVSQGLLPPPVNGPGFDGLNTPYKPNSINDIPLNGNSFQNGPVIITDVSFAPKPANGLLPPKDPIPSDIIGADSLSATPKDQNTNNFGQFGVLGGTPATNNVAVPSRNNSPPPTPTFSNNPNKNSDGKYTGNFGGSPGILGGSPVAPSNNNNYKPPQGQFGGGQGLLSIPVQKPTQPINQIPVTVVLSPQPNNRYNGGFGGPTGVLGKPGQNQPPPTQIAFTPGAAPDTGKYSGTFGGSSGVLTSSNTAYTTQSAASQQQFLTNSVVPTVANNNYQGAIGGAAGVFGNSPAASVPTPTVVQLDNASSHKHTGLFGGPPGVLSPFDNGKQ